MKRNAMERMALEEIERLTVLFNIVGLNERERKMQETAVRILKAMKKMLVMLDEDGLNTQEKETAMRLLRAYLVCE